MEVNEQLQEGLAKFGTISVAQAVSSSASVPTQTTCANAGAPRRTTHHARISCAELAYGEMHTYKSYANRSTSTTANTLAHQTGQGARYRA
jgi:hypothetical protein